MILILAPITKNLQKNTTFIWTFKNRRILHEIANTLRAWIKLQHPNLATNFTLEDNASGTEFGRELFQEGAIVRIFSRKYTSSQANYTVEEKNA